MKKTIFLLFILLCCITTLNAQITYVPDDNFEQALIDLGYDTVLNNYVNTSNINTVTFLDVSGKNIADLTGIEDFTALTELRCFNNQLSFLNISNNTNLSKLLCGNNQLTSLPVGNNTALTELFCRDNLLTSLDVSNNTALTVLSCFNNQLTDLNVKNGNNSNFTTFNATNNLNLTCIQVNNVAYCTNNWTNIDPQSYFSQDCNYPQTYVPDDNFEQALIDLGYDSTLDDYVTTPNINNVTTLNVSFKNISDLTGIEDFTALTYLRCDVNQLSSLDVSNNTALTALYCYNNQLTNLNVGNTPLTILSCYDNQLTSLDVSNNTALIELNCHNNQLTSLDVSNNTVLTELFCRNNLLTNLDVSNNTALTNLLAGNNLLTSLDLSNNTALTFLNCFDNQLTSLNLSNNTALTNLSCYNNQLTSLDLSNNTALTILNCYNNQLTSLDLSINTALTRLTANDNQLTSLNVKNGNNSNMVVFDTTNNPNLTCIEVDDAVYSTDNWTDIDPQSYFSEDCSNVQQTYVPDDNFEQALIDLGYDDVLDDYVLTANINTVTSLNVSSKNIADLTGIEDFTALTELYCINNLLTSLSIGNNTALITLYCYNNQLTNLDVSNNTALTTLYCYNNQLTNLNVGNTPITVLNCFDNQLTSLNLSNNTALTNLFCENNQLTSLNLSNNTALIDLACENNQLTSLDLSNNTALTLLRSNDNQLISLNVKNGNNSNMVVFDTTNNPNLTCIQVDDAVYSTDNWTDIDPQSYFSEDCSNVQQTYVPDDNFEQALIDLGYDDVLDDYVLTANINTVTSLNVSSKNIADLTGIEGFTILINLNCNSNVLTDIDLQNNVNLSILLCQNNQLTSLNLSNNTTLTNLRCGNNQLTNLDVSNNSMLTELRCQSNQLTGLDIRNGNNTNISNTDFNATNNPDLTCIFVDDATWSTTNWTNIDPSSTFVETQTQCNALSVEEAYLYEFTVYPNPAEDILTIESNIDTMLNFYSITGKLLIEKNIKQGNNNSIDISALNSGIYFVKIENQIKKIIIK